MIKNLSFGKKEKNEHSLTRVTNLKEIPYSQLTEVEKEMMAKFPEISHNRYEIVGDIQKSAEPYMETLITEKNPRGLFDKLTSSSCPPEIPIRNSSVRARIIKRNRKVAESREEQKQKKEEENKRRRYKEWLTRKTNGL